MSDVDELIRELDLDAALARTYELGDGLRRRSANRRRWATGGGLVAAGLLAALLVPTIGGDDPSQSVGLDGIADGGTTSETPASTPSSTVVPAFPDGYILSRTGDVWVLAQVVPIPATTTSSDGAAVGIGTALASERGTLESYGPGPDENSVSVTFACVAGDQKINVVRYRVEPTRIVVDAEINYDPGAAGCLPSSEGSTTWLPLPAPFVPGTPIVVEPLHNP